LNQLSCFHHNDIFIILRSEFQFPKTASLTLMSRTIRNQRDQYRYPGLNHTEWVSNQIIHSLPVCLRQIPLLHFSEQASTVGRISATIQEHSFQTYPTEGFSHVYFGTCAGSSMGAMCAGGAPSIFLVSLSADDPSLLGNSVR